MEEIFLILGSGICWKSTGKRGGRRGCQAGDDFQFPGSLPADEGGGLRGPRGEETSSERGPSPARVLFRHDDRWEGRAGRSAHWNISPSETLKKEPASVPCIFSDQQGRGRTTLGMVIACLIKEMQITSELRSAGQQHQEKLSIIHFFYSQKNGANWPGF